MPELNAEQRERLVLPSPLDDNEKEPCMFPGCDQQAVALLANEGTSPLSHDYAERWVCRWHCSNPFGDTSVTGTAAGGDGR